MRNFLIRVITGLLYVTLTIGSILAGKYTFVVLFTFLMAYTLYEFYRLCKNGGNKPQVFTGILISVYFFVSLFFYEMQMVGEIIFFGIIPLLILIPITEIFRTNKQPTQNIAYTLLGIVYIALPFSVLHFIATPYNAFPEKFVPEALIGLFIIIWANDSGAYLIGSNFGKTKMIERISPKKTWEGLVGGTLSATLISFIFFYITGIISPFHAIVLGLLTVVFGTLGDLTESILKRSFGVKDSGNLLPGHGGLLDRFDSMLFAAPIYYIYISLILNY